MNFWLLELIAHLHMWKGRSVVLSCMDDQVLSDVCAAVAEGYNYKGSIKMASAEHPVD